MAFDEIHARLQEARRRHHQAEYLLCTLLYELKKTRLYQERGHASVVAYGEVELGLSAKLVETYVRIGGRLRKLPLVAARFAEGALGYTVVREIARVATAETEEAWVSRAEHSTCRELEAQVAYAFPGDMPPDPKDLPLKPTWVRRHFEMVATDAMAVDQALVVLRQLGEYDESVTAGQLLADLARRFLAAPPDGAPVTEEVFRVVIQECPKCDSAHVGGHEVTDAVRAMAECDGQVVDLRTPPGKEPRMYRTVTPAMRRNVMDEHGNRCVVPYCRARIWLHTHHFVFRSQGGEHARTNLWPMCTAHHHQVHHGQLILVMTPAGLRFFLHDGTPFGAPFAGDARTTLGDEVLRLLDGQPKYPFQVQDALKLPDGRAERLLSMLKAQGAAFEDAEGRWGRVDRLARAAPTWARCGDRDLYDDSDLGHLPDAPSLPMLTPPP